MEGSYWTGGTPAVVQFMADRLSFLRVATICMANPVYTSYISRTEEKKRKRMDGAHE